MQLFVVIAAANDVKCDVASNSTFVYAYGFAEDIDASHALYASLVMQMVKASEAYIGSGAHRPTPTITARLNFQLAFGARVGQRLAEAREQARREATKDRKRRTRYRDRVAEQGHRAEGLLPRRRRRPGARGGPPARPRGTRRRRGGPATGRGAGPGWAATPELAGARGVTGEVT